MSASISQRYTITNEDGSKQVYTDVLSRDGKTVRTYRSDGTLFSKKEFNSKGQYVITRYNVSGTKEEYHAVGGAPDERTSYLLGRRTPAPKKTFLMPFCHRLTKIRGE